MKSLVSWMCLFAASASQQVFADVEFKNYRLGNYHAAAESLMKRTDSDPVADYYLGRMYLYGYGQLKNKNLAMRYFDKAAAKGFLPAVHVMAKYVLLHEKKPEEAIKWFKQAANTGDVNAQMFMAAAYLYGVGVKKNTDMATKYYIDAAKNGNSIAQFALAEHFMSSKQASNHKLGLIWLNKSASSGNPKALTKLGHLYLVGQLVGKDSIKGMELLTKAAEQKDTSAMIDLGDAFLQQKEYTQAMAWFDKAANQQNINAYLHIAHAYLQENTPIYDPKAGFMWTLKAAEYDVTGSKEELAQLYLKGIGVTVNPQLAAEWERKAALDSSSKNEQSALSQVALWLSNGATDKLERTPYQMGGIFSAWQNTNVLRDSIYNQAPHMEKMTRKELFKPQFELASPNEVPIDYYYDALVSKNTDSPANQWTYPLYPLNKFVEAQEHVSSFMLSKVNLPIPFLYADYSQPDDFSNSSLMDFWTPAWQQQANYASVFNHLYFKAILGEAQSQFEIGQMFQYGIGVPQSKDSALIFYQNAAAQQHLGAEYNLGLLHLNEAKDRAEYQEALNWLTDSAFKGNSRAQYVLSKMLSQGKTVEAGTVILEPSPDQALSMLYLSAANHFGLAEYELAEHLARQYDNGLSLGMKKQKLALIRQLYHGAAQNGVLQALLPLAFYNAMDSDKQRQLEAFNVAEQQAQSGDSNAALLLGILYDRGIGISADPQKAMYWYEQSGQNIVSQFILGTYAYQGKGVAEDKIKGKALLQQSADSAFSYANFNLAVIDHDQNKDFLSTLMKAYHLGNSHAGIVLADYYLAENDQANKRKEAQTIYLKLAQKGSQYAQLKLGYMYEYGLGVVPSASEALHWYMASAEQDNPDAQYLLGQYYQLGENGLPDYQLAKEWYKKASTQLPKANVALGFIEETVEDNYTEALRSYEKAAEKGDPMGVYNEALMYEYGKGVPVDYQKAKILYTEAAGKGVDEAMNQLGGIYFYGLGQPRDVQQSLSWYKKSAALGNSNALYQLGLLSETGVATKLDFAEALKYYKESSEKGNEKAMLALARMYHYGLGIGKDLKKSASLYEKLANVQNAYAQYQLASYYLEGILGERSPEKAKALLRQASENGNLQAKKMLERLEAESQPRVSFIEPVVMNHATLVDKSADLIYLDALNEWNRGDEVLSRMILQRLVTQYPNFVPAKKIYERLNQVKVNAWFS